MSVSPNPLLIGARDAQNGLNLTVDGLIDNVEILNTALTPAQIAQSWNNSAGVPVGTPSPVIAITSTALQSDQTTVSLSGTIDTADAGLTISIYDGTALLGTTTASTAGIWSTSVTVSAQGVHTLTAQATNSGGTGISNSVVDLVSAATSLGSGGQIVLFSGAGDAVALSGSSNAVSGSNGFVYLNSAQARVTGGGNGIMCAGTGDSVRASAAPPGIWDWVAGTGSTVLSRRRSKRGGGRWQCRPLRGHRRYGGPQRHQPAPGFG